ncbi:MAG: hypothetical protein ABJA37_12900 [Ferruginibacter sp.]
MNTNLNNSPLKLVTQQTTNNTTSWVGHNKDRDISKGQTFIATNDGELQTIEVFSNIVFHPGKVTITVYNFDPQQKKWGTSLGCANVDFKKTDIGKWIAFNIPSLHLDKGKFYGFILESHECYMGVGEAAGSFKNPPFTEGQEWHFTNNNDKGDSFSYFSLAFKIGLTA